MMHESNECGILKEKKYGNEQGKQHAFQGRGRKLGGTNVIRLSLVLLGVDVVMDATLQLVRKDGGPLLEILGIKPFGQQ